MFTWLRKLLSGPPRIVDPVFGPLLYMGGYWEGSGIFPPTATKIEWFVTASEHGPTPENYEVFQAMCVRFAELRLKAHQALLQAVSEYEKSKVPALDALRISSVDVRTSLTEEADWEMNFSATEPKEVMFSVAFNGWEPTGAVEITE